MMKKSENIDKNYLEIEENLEKRGEIRKITEKSDNSDDFRKKKKKKGKHG